MWVLNINAIFRYIFVFSVSNIIEWFNFKKRVKISLIVTSVISLLLLSVGLFFVRYPISWGTYALGHLFLIIAPCALVFFPLLFWGISVSKESPKAALKSLPILSAIFLTIGVCLTAAGIIYTLILIGGFKMFRYIVFIPGGLFSIYLSLTLRVVYNEKTRMLNSEQENFDPKEEV